MKKKKNIIQVLGPVDSLESYVKAEWWREIFNANYLRTDGDVVNDQHITSEEINIFQSILKLKPEHAILDLCCGQGRHIRDLAKRGYQNVYGLDRSHYLVTKAKSLSKQEGVLVNLKEGDARKPHYPPDTFDFVMILGNSFGYFESKRDDIRVLKSAFRVLKPDAKIFIDVTDGEYIRKSFSPRSWEWIDKNYFVCRERNLSKDNERLISREVITHVKKGVIADQFYAERLYSSTSLQNLLKEAGFSNITMHRDFSPKSLRNQDLGMMARRILISAEVNKPWTKIMVSESKQKSVAVLLGDPKRNDIIKPNARFDEDDLHTVLELKKALATCGEYSFSYINDHENLMIDLKQQKSEIDFVFNLCDEGFNNDPTKELHIPALLEMLEIPYSGGTPQCLAFCYDKSLVRGVANELDIPTPQAFVLKPEDISFIEFPIQFPVIVKPNLGDSSYGITKDSVCYNVEQLESIITKLREKVGFETTILVEEFLSGKDLSIGIIGNLPDAYTVLPIIEEDYSMLPKDLPKICGYEAKWNPSSPYWKYLRSIPAELPEETVRFLVANCLKLFGRLNCRDYARLDWRLDSNGTPRLLEVNPNPGWCWDGHLAKMAKLANYSYAQMLKQILSSAEKRIAARAAEINGTH